MIGLSTNFNSHILKNNLDKKLPESDKPYANMIHTTSD